MITEISHGGELIISLRASSPFGGYREKYTRERHARGDATRGFAARSRVLARLASLAQIGELARRLANNEQQDGKKRRTAKRLCVTNLTPLLFACFVVIFT